MQQVMREIVNGAYRISGEARDYDPLLERVGDARLVLLGEATHGTHEFYRIRAEISQRLIEEKGFHAVAVEADWPDAFRVHNFVRGRGDDSNPDQALGSFERFPRWMWRNTDVHDFVVWLRGYNASTSRKVGFYGVDLYSLNRSIESVLRYLDKVEPEAAKRARERYGCFDHYGDDSQLYGYTTALGMSKTCEDEVVHQLVDLQRRAADLAMRDGRVAEDEFFSAEQNARVVRNAERYYRAMFSDRLSTWNLRDQHMAETIDNLLDHLDARVGRSKIIVWEHNSHLGDARATEMSARGELNVGQLVRLKYASETVLVGFTTYSGSVRAADNWDSPDKIKRVRPGLPGSYEELFHEAGIPAFLLVFDGHAELARGLADPRLERAIGVIYRPETERLSHYFHARLPHQFDAVIHVDETRAVVALGGPEERASHVVEHEPAETFPSGV
jgi:erythromycin esterase-like protein